MKNLIKLFIFFLFISGCTKIGKTVTIKGRVLNPVTGEGIAGAAVWLQKTTLGLPGGNKTIKKATTDANGNYEINKATLRYLTLLCTTYKLDKEYLGLGFKDPETGVGYHVKKFKTQHWDYHAVPYGNLKLDILNVNCEGTTDTMNFRSKYQYGLDFESYSSDRLGCYAYISSGSSKLPIGEYVYEMKVKRPSGTVTIQVIANIVEGVETVVQLHY